MGRVKRPDSYAILLFVGSQPGAVGTTRSILQCQETILFARIGLVGVCYGYMVKEARDAAKHTAMHKTEACNKMLPGPKCQ